MGRMSEDRSGGSPVLAGAPTAASAATRPAPADSAVRVASYNILHVTSGTGKKSWAHRRKALVRTVRAASPDVLLVQEANTQKWKGRRHIDDVRAIGRRAVIAVVGPDDQPALIGQRDGQRR